MNIFRLHNDPNVLPEYLEDGHVNSQLHECVQMMSTALHLKGHDSDMIFAPTHETHPMTQWVAEGVENFCWVYDLTKQLFEEKKHRWGGGHDSWEKTGRFMPRRPNGLPDTATIQPVVGTATEYIDAPSDPESHSDVVRAYRTAYFDDDRNYRRDRDRPEWEAEYARV